MDLGLRDKNAIITGATKGIGREILELLIAEGCNVATCSRSIEDVEATIEKCSTRKAQVYGDVCDVRDKEEYEADLRHKYQQKAARKELHGGAVQEVVEVVED